MEGDKLVCIKYLLITLIGEYFYCFMWRIWEKRFQKVSKNLPKILAEISPGISMLDWLVQDYLPLKSSIILATGHLHDKVSEYIEKEIMEII